MGTLVVFGLIAGALLLFGGGKKTGGGAAPNADPAVKYVLDTLKGYWIDPASATGGQGSSPTVPGVADVVLYCDAHQAWPNTQGEQDLQAQGWVRADVWALATYGLGYSIYSSGDLTVPSIRLGAAAPGTPVADLSPLLPQGVI